MYSKPYPNCHAKSKDVEHLDYVKKAIDEKQEKAKAFEQAKLDLRKAEREYKTARENHALSVMKAMGIGKGDRVSTHDYRYGEIVFEVDGAYIKEGRVVNVNGTVVSQPQNKGRPLKRYGANMHQVLEKM